MAARTSTSVGVGVTIVILSLLAFTFFVLSIIFFGNKGKVEKQLADLQANYSSIVSDSEKVSDVVRRYEDLAAQQRKTVVGYLADSMRGTMSKVTGIPGDTIESLTTKLDNAGVSGPLFQAMQNRDQQIAAYQQQLDDAEHARSDAEQDLLNERARVDAIRGEYETEQTAMASQVSQAQEQVDRYREGINALETEMDRKLEDCRNTARDNEAQLRDEVRQKDAEILRLQDNIARLQQEKSKDLISPTDEYALVDGTIAGVNPVTGNVSISLGRRDKIKLGMTFAVYTDATAIKPDAAGNYPRPKGEIEIIRLDEESATCRVLNERAGNPIARGDVIANPVYDPKKIYVFLIEGNFDADGDGVATPLEQQDIEAMIRDWGGKVTDELTGNVDFLVLGARPVLGPAPSGRDPLPVQQEYIRQTQRVKRYDELFDKAVKTSIPILNLNRLETLVAGR